jgi:hypothetical protein
MATTQLQTLLGAVRRRLWRGQFVAAVRRALWGSAGLMLLAAAVHLAARAVSIDAVLSALAVLWAAALVQAGWRRPSDSACALSADRHLGGASAFSTLLEMGQGAQGTANAKAMQCLETWASARVPEGLRLLAERQEAAHLARPLLSMLVCSALATLVLTLSEPAPSSRPQVVASSGSRDADPAMPAAEALGSAELVGEIAGALRSAESRDAPEPSKPGNAPAAGRGKSDDGPAPNTAQAGTTQPGELATATGSSRATAVEAAAAARSAQGTGTGSGRDAGDSRDERADVGVSRALRGAIPVQRSELRALRTSTERQADMDRLATYDEDQSMHGEATARAGPTPAAATPPPVTEATRLTPAETTYVQAWMRASERRR